MLQSVYTLSPPLTPEERFAVILQRGIVAVSPETGAYLVRGNGRSRSRKVKYVLVVPDEPYAAFDYSIVRCMNERTIQVTKTVKAFHDAEAVDLVNQKFPAFVGNPAVLRGNPAVRRGKGV